MYLKTLSSFVKCCDELCCDYHMNIPGKGKEDKTGGQNFGFCESFYTYNVTK